MHEAFLRRLTETLAGLTASAGSQWETAEVHFERALRQTETMPHRLERPELLLWAWGEALLVRAGSVQGLV